MGAHHHGQSCLVHLHVCSHGSLYSAGLGNRPSLLPACCWKRRHVESTPRVARVSGCYSNTLPCCLGIYTDSPILYEKRRFQRAGFHDARHNQSNEFEGASSASNNAAWDKLLSGKHTPCILTLHASNLTLDTPSRHGDYFSRRE